MVIGKASRRLTRAVGAALLVAALAVAGYVAPATAATTTSWASFTPLTGATGAYASTMTFGTAPGLTAQVTSNSRSGQVGVISGASTWLSQGTPVGAKYGSSLNQPYLNLRPFADAARIPSITTYTFESPAPASGWTFVLGDIDADSVQISAVTATGSAATAAELGYRSGFNYCAAATVGKPSCTGDPLDVPTWDVATTTLTGNITASDTAGSAAWFEPNVALASLTFSFTARSGLPIYQTWFASIARDIGGNVVTTDGLAEAGATVQLFDTNGQSAATAMTGADGSYLFPGFTAAAGYTVELAAPAGKTVVGPALIAVDISEADATNVDFAMQEIPVTSSLGGTIIVGGAPAAGVEVLLEGPAGASTVLTDAQGQYIADDLEPGAYTVTVVTRAGAYPLSDTVIQVDVPIDGTPAIDANFEFGREGSVSGAVRDTDGAAIEGVVIEIDGPTGPATSTTDAEGAYSVGELTAGQYTLTPVAPEGYAAVSPPSTQVTITTAGEDLANGDFTLTAASPDPDPTPTPTDTAPSIPAPGLPASGHECPCGQCPCGRSVSPRRAGSVEQQRGLFEHRGDVGDEARHAITVDDTVIERARDRGDPSRAHLAVDDPGLLADRAHSDDAGLAGVDDGGSRIHPEHPDVGDCDRAAALICG